MLRRWHTRERAGRLILPDNDTLLIRKDSRSLASLVMTIFYRGRRWLRTTFDPASTTDIDNRQPTTHNNHLHCVPLRACIIVNVRPDPPMTDHPHTVATFETKVKPDSPRFARNQKAVADLMAQVRKEEETIRLDRKS